MVELFAVAFMARNELDNAVRQAQNGEREMRDSRPMVAGMIVGSLLTVGGLSGCATLVGNWESTSLSPEMARDQFRLVRSDNATGEFLQAKVTFGEDGWYVAETYYSRRKQPPQRNLGVRKRSFDALRRRARGAQLRGRLRPRRDISDCPADQRHRRRAHDDAAERTVGLHSREGIRKTGAER